MEKISVASQNIKPLLNGLGNDNIAAYSMSKKSA